MTINNNYSKLDMKIIGILIFILAIYLCDYSLEIYSGEVTFPRECHGKGSLFCTFTNMVYEIHGIFAVSIIYFVLTTITFYFSYYFFKGPSKNLQVSETINITPEVEQVQETKKKQTIEDVIVKGEEPTDEFLEDFIALENAPELSDEELERQALAQTNPELITRKP